MKKFLIIVLLCMPFLLIAEKCVRGANPFGFFAEFLWALNHIEYCVANNKTPVIYWGEKFAYYSLQGYNGAYNNGWEYYFEPVSQASFTPGDYLHVSSWYSRKNNFSTLWYYHQYIQNKHLLTAEEQKSFKGLQGHKKKYLKLFPKLKPYPVGKHHLYDKKFRKWVYENLITPFIKIKLPIINKINDFYTKNIKNKTTIGIHLRGDHLCKGTLPVDLSVIFAEANKYAGKNVQFFIATDQQPLLEKAKKELKGHVIYYPGQRFGKTTSPYAGIKLDPVLGENVLIETILLSYCDHLIHTLSNVSTTALYFNPNLRHTLIF